MFKSDVIWLIVGIIMILGFVAMELKWHEAPSCDTIVTACGDSDDER